MTEVTERRTQHSIKWESSFLSGHLETLGLKQTEAEWWSGRWKDPRVWAVEPALHLSSLAGLLLRTLKTIMLRHTLPTYSNPLSEHKCWRFPGMFLYITLFDSRK